MFDYGTKPTLYNRPSFYSEDGSINPERVKWDAAWIAQRTGEEPLEVEKRLWPSRLKEQKKMMRRKRRRNGFWRNLFRGTHDPGSEMGPGPVSSWYGRR